MGVLDWLLDSDPAIRWQVMRDLLGAPAEQVEEERARVAVEGWGAHLLGLQRPDGQWEGGEPEFTSPEAASWWHSLPADRRGTLFPEWTSTCWSLSLLREFGVPPQSAPAQRAVRLVAARCRWEHDGEPNFVGEVEPCINGRVVAVGSYFGQEVGPVVERLLAEQLSDGGWNCERENGSVSGSFHTTIEVLSGLLEYERATGGSSGVQEARSRGQEYLLERRMRRRLSTGEVIDPEWDTFSFPTYWHYDVLRGLDFLRLAGTEPDPRVKEAVELVRSKADTHGRWPLESPHPGRLHFPIDKGEGWPSRWNTLRALRVLKWADSG